MACLHRSEHCRLCFLQAVHAGLLSGRRLIWEEAARRIGALLSSPAAFEGEHFLQAGAHRNRGSVQAVVRTGSRAAGLAPWLPFLDPMEQQASLLTTQLRPRHHLPSWSGHHLQVMEWTQRILAVGESFAGCECASLRTLLERQSGKFFRLYHHSNIEVGAARKRVFCSMHHPSRREGGA